MDIQTNIKKIVKRRIRKAGYGHKKGRIGKTWLFPLIGIFLLSLFICHEITFLNHYESLLRTCETALEKPEEFRDLNISSEVLDMLWKKSMGSMDSFLDKVTMNMLLNGFCVTSPGEIIPSYWYYWDKLVPDTLYEDCFSKYKTIFEDLVYFPVAEDVDNKVTVNFENSWMKERTYGGQRGHEGTDLMAGNNQRGYFPVVSMTDGIIEQKGWLEMGGYRIGVRSPSGAYFYYAHLDSYAPDLEKGDQVTAGQLLGMMGDSGYSKVEGTTGNFDVHLHMGIYIPWEGEDISINPYWVLKYLEDNKVEWSEK